MRTRPQTDPVAELTSLIRNLQRQGAAAALQSHRHDRGATFSTGDLKLSVAPGDGWALMGQTLINAATQFPDLFAVAPLAWRSGNDLVLPAMTPLVSGSAWYVKT